VKGVIELRGIRKEFRSPFLRRTKLALEGLDLTVESGEVFGFLGPNGAGKTTTIKVLLGLIRATEGAGTVLGKPFGSVEARQQLGFLPDAPNFYRYLSAREFLELAGGLHRMDRATLPGRIEAVFDRVHLERDARDRALHTFSRGMLQRTGLAAAILHRPKLVILDEPMNGLDPAGRAEFRTLLRTLKDEGVTVFLSSHVLADIEATADRVGILKEGRLVQCGTLRECLATDSMRIEIAFEPPDTAMLERLRPNVDRLQRDAGGWVAETEEAEANATVRTILEAGGHLLRYGPRRVTLEDFFLERVAGRAGRRELPPRPVREAQEPIDAPERAGGMGTPARKTVGRGGGR